MLRAAPGRTQRSLPSPPTTPVGPLRGPTPALLILAACGGTAAPAGPRAPIDPPMAMRPAAPPVPPPYEPPALTPYALAEPPTADDDAPLIGEVLVWQDARLHLAASASAPAVRLGALAGPRRDRPGRVVPMTVVATRAEWVTVTPSASRCVDARASVSPLAAPRFFVRRTDLAPVLSAHHARQFDDGTTIEADAGAPIAPTVDGGWLVAGLGWPQRIEATAAAGFAYAQAPSVAALPSRAMRELAAGTTVTIGPEAYALGARPGGWPSDAPIDTLGRARVTLSAPCATAQAIAPARSVVAADHARRAPSTDGDVELVTYGTHVLPAGTAVTSGRIRFALAVDTLVSPAPRAAQVCLDVVLALVGADQDASTPEAERSLRVCAPTRAARPRPSAPSIVPSTTPIDDEDGTTLRLP